MDCKRPQDFEKWSQREEDVIYHASLEEALAEQGGKTWAHGVCHRALQTCQCRELIILLPFP